MRSHRPAVRVQRRPPPGRRIDPKTAARVRLTESQTRRKTSAISSLACGRCGAAFPRERRPSEVGSKALDLVFDGVGSPLRFEIALQRRRAELGENPLPLLAGCRSTAALMAACGAQLWVSFEREERTMAGFVPTGRCLSFAAKGPNENGSC